MSNAFDHAARLSAIPNYVLLRAVVLTLATVPAGGQYRQYRRGGTGGAAGVCDAYDDVVGLKTALLAAPAAIAVSVLFHIFFVRRREQSLA